MNLGISFVILLYSLFIFNFIDSTLQNETTIESAFKWFRALDIDPSSKVVKIYIKDHCSLYLRKNLTRKDLYECIKNLEGTKKVHKNVLVTGGAGFLGSHLVDSLMLKGYHVMVLDNLSTGRLENIAHWLEHPNFILKSRDVINPLDSLDVDLDQIYHLASPASPMYYMMDPVKTIKTNTIGTLNMLNLAKKSGARLVLASTSEVYGDPKIHPQDETYWGNTNPIGPRSCYDESKRLAESLTSAFKSSRNVSTGIARIFNTYGPRMDSKDGRVVSNFITQVLSNKPITVYGDGSQTRSFQYITDLVLGLEELMASNVTSPVNLGNPEEMTINELAAEVKRHLPNSTSEILYEKLPVDDPNRRRPDIRKAMLLLDWKPTIDLAHGLEKTIEYFRL